MKQVNVVNSAPNRTRKVEVARRKVKRQPGRTRGESLIGVATHVFISIFVDIPEARESCCVSTEWHPRFCPEECENETGTLDFAFIFFIFYFVS